ncbi:hypothetical protein Cgig2_011181 [Carnegiea gigantea]|uniref:Uncharacterized protein n=1 Tax=Carnegiea gigantea TaxID=171969 RepID=A0A9Q1JMD8_9CARY|nr:hypothetical protein Cgig2_011181 [Carnegiea gigantea]
MEEKKSRTRVQHLLTGCTIASHCPKGRRPPPARLHPAHHHLKRRGPFQHLNTASRARPFPGIGPQKFDLRSATPTTQRNAPTKIDTGDEGWSPHSYRSHFISANGVVSQAAVQTSRLAPLRMFNWFYGRWPQDCPQPRRNFRSPTDIRRLGADSTFHLTTSSARRADKM